MFRCLWIFAVILATPGWAAVRDYSVVLGDTGMTSVTAMAIDSQGNAYVGGSTGAADFPVTPGAFQTRLRGFEGFCDFLTVGILGSCGNAFVAKLDLNGKIVWATYLGGSQFETVAGIGFDSSGNVLVAGLTFSPDFPTTTTDGSGGPASFVVKLSPDGASLIYSFLFSADTIAGLAVGPAGNAYVVGLGFPGSLATTPDAFQTQSAGADEGYVGKLNQAGSGWDYLTFLSGSGEDFATGIAVNANGEAYVAGGTASPNLPGAVRGARKTLTGETDAFVVKFNASGSGVFWSSYLGAGGVSGEMNWASIALDATGSVYAASTGYAVAPTLCKLSPDGSAFVYSKGIPADTTGQTSIAVDAAGEVYLGWTTSSRSLPVTPGALEGANYAPDAGYILKFDGTASNVLYASYFGGGSGWAGELGAIGLDAAGHLYAAGYGYPLTLSYESGFVVKADLTRTPSVWLGAVVNSASFVAGTIAPGELVTLYGAGLGPATPVAGQLVDGTLPTELGGVQVLVGGVPAPLLYVSSGQINAVVPFEASPTSEFQVSVQGETSDAFGILSPPGPPPLAASTSVGIFTRDPSGQGQAAALNQDGTPNSASNPAPRGSIVAIWLTGAGNTIPPETDGEITPVGSRTSLTGPSGACLCIGSWREGVEFVYAGAAPGLVAGVDQVNFRIPEDADTGPAVRLKFAPFFPAFPPQAVTIAIR
jgi:uncharacterized protein (TIGR03437 family)